jgi:hypothetical protein
MAKTPEERLRIDALRYRALRYLTAFAPTLLDEHADRIRKQLADDGIVFETPPDLYPEYDIAAPLPPRPKRKWSKERREKQAKAIANRKLQLVEKQ